MVIEIVDAVHCGSGGDAKWELVFGELSRVGRVELGHGLGRNTLVYANWRLPWARELRSILMRTVGVLGQLSAALVSLRGVEEAFVFGSWAARYQGEPGPSPRDVDVAVIGEASLQSARKAIAGVEAELRIEVNPVVIDRTRWAAKRPEPFIAHIKGQPKVTIPLVHP